MRLRFLGISQLFKCQKCIDTTELKKKFKLFYYTFFYNEFSSTDSFADAALNPLFCMVDNFVYFSGPVFVILVWSLMLYFVVIFYSTILPEIYNTSSIINFLINFIIGSWLAVNTLFHYTMGWRTKPGSPPNTKFDNVVSICKKCMSGKPPRTHHCSVCNKCVLKMDHHCPWFNNCIGFYNHRYFFLYCTFMTIDTLYLITIGFHYYQQYVYPDMNLRIYNLFEHQLVPNAAPGSIASQQFYKLATVEFFIAFVAFFALFFLSTFNAFLVSIGATNIEIRTINFNILKPRSIDHPYNLGFVNNWKYFLGFDNFKTFITHVILPSRHKPSGDGISWDEYTQVRDRTRSDHVKLEDV